MPDKNYPSVGFFFVVGFDKTNNKNDGSFQEVSGIKMEMEMEALTEGGENRFKFQLPSVSKFSNLVLKRGLLVQNSALANWIQDILENGLKGQINPKIIYVSLMGAESKPLITWCFYNVSPVKWIYSGLDSKKENILTETIEFTYTHFDVMNKDVESIMNL